MKVDVIEENFCSPRRPILTCTIPSLTKHFKGEYPKEQHTTTILKQQQFCKWGWLKNQSPEDRISTLSIYI